LPATDDFIDYVLIRELGLTPEQAATIPAYLRVFIAEFLAE
jgi:hypothetical protein